MKPILTVLVCAGVIIFTSCQKDITEELKPPPHAADTLLSTILIYDTATPGRDMNLVQFIYDAQDRVIEIRDIFFDSTNGSMSIHDEFSTFFYYNGSDKKPYRSYGWTRYLFTEYDVYHFYDAQGRLILDSLGAPNGAYMVNHFNYTQDQLVVVSSTYDANQQLVIHENSDSCYFAGGNVSRAFTEYPVTLQREDIFEYAYDDKVNPLSKMNIAVCMGVDKYAPLDKMWVLPWGMSRNNIIKRVSNSSSLGMSRTTEYQFTYNENNLPVLGVFREIGLTNEGIRARYEYVKK
jgi:hypothetical protein